MQPLPSRDMVHRRGQDELSGVFFLGGGKLGEDGLQVQCRVLRSGRGRVPGVSGGRVVSWGAGGAEKHVCCSLECTCRKLGEG